MKEYEGGKNQLEILDTFYKEYFKLSNVQLGYRIPGVMFLVFLVIFCCFPYQSIAQDLKDGLVLVVFMGMYGTIAYIAAYRHAYDRNGRIVGLAPHIQYLPISARTLKEYQMRKMLKLQWKVYLFAQAGQILFSLLVVHGLSWCNFLYPITIALVMPLIWTTLTILASK